MALVALGRMEITLVDGTVIRGERMTPYDNAEPETLDTALADKIDSLCSGEQAARLHALARTGGLQNVHEIFSK